MSNEKMRIYRIVSTGGVVAVLGDGVAADWIARRLPKEWGSGRFWVESGQIEESLSIAKTFNRPLGEILTEDK